MRHLSWRNSAFVLAAAVFALASSPAARAQDPPPDDSTVLTEPPEDGKGTESAADQDDATARLEAERAAWGLVTPEFRHNAIQEGLRHGNRRNKRGPLGVNIGPTGADFEQNCSFTGHVRDSGRARAILPHPTNPDIVYVLTSGGGLWGTLNWRSSDTKWFPLTDNLPTTGGGSVAFGRNPTTLYLGLGDPYDQILVGGAMVRS